MEERDLVLLEQVEDAVVVLLDDGFLASKELVDVHAQALDRNAMLAEMLAGVLEMLGRLQQGFRRNAADVGAGTARCGAALGIAPGIDASNRLPELGSTNRSDVAAGAGANHHYVKLFGHLMI